MKKLRLFAALFVVFGPLFFVSPAQADEVTEPVVVVVTTPGGDDSSYQIPLTTTVTFDGVQYGSVYATTNSVITFGQPDGTYWTFPQTPSISLYSMDWVVYPNQRADEHLIIAASDGGFQVDISARPIWLQNATEPTNINIVAAINADGTVAISYSIVGPTYEGQTRTGVTLTSGQVVTLEEYGVVQVTEPPVLTPEPVVPTPDPTPTVDPTPEPTIDPTPEPTVEPTPVVTPPTVPQGATLLSEGSSIEVVAPAGQRITSITAWYGDPDDGSRGVEVSSTLTQLASGQTSVTIDSSNVYGDPAPGTVKTLIFVVNYETIPAPVDPVVPVPEPTPTSTPEPTPTQEPSPTPTVEPTPTASPEPTVVPTPEPSPQQTTEPTPSPTVEPRPQPDPSPSPTPGPVPVPPSNEGTGNPQPGPSVTPSPTPTSEPEPVVPTPEPTVEPEPTPEPTVGPSPEPSPPVVEPSKEPDPEVVVVPEPPVVKPVAPEPPVVTLPDNPTVAETVAVMDELTTIAPENLTDAQVELLVEAANATFLIAEPGSEAYEQALEALAVAANADDAELPAELAAIPVLGEALGAALEVFNDLGNIGADMAPAVRAAAEKVVVSAIIVTQVATSAAVSAAVASASAPSSSSRKIK